MTRHKSTFKHLLCGMVTGSLNGIFGGGGGMIAVPCLERLLGFSPKEAHATAILIIAPISIVAAVGYIFGGYFVAEVVVPVTYGTVLGGMVGAKILQKLKTSWVEWLFSLLMAAAGLAMLGVFE